MFAFFEKLVDPFPPAVPVTPPASLSAFMWHYCRPIAPHLLLVALTGAGFAVLEVALFGFLGDLVDLFASTERELFWQQHFWWLISVSALILLVMPAIDLLHESIANQSVTSNFPMRIRWLAHRYLLRQSIRFFEDDFAGRLATKVMQTATAVRDVAELTVEVLVYALVYLISAFVLFLQTDWRITAPLAVWLLGYAAAMRFFVPRLQKVAKEQAEARSQVTGRIVDSYTNIQTVKLFAHTLREENYAKSSMTPFLYNVRQQMRLVSGLNFTIETMNGLLLLSVAATGIWLWTQEAVSAGAVALALGLVLRLKGMAHWIMWEVASLFENIGMVQDGVATLSREQSLVDKPQAAPLQVTTGRIGFESVRFHYGKDGGVLDDFSLRIAPGERVGLVGPSGAGKSTVVNLLLRFYDTEAGTIRIDGQDIAAVTQDSLRASIGLVTQDTALLHRSVRDNICYGFPDASDAEVRAAVRAAKVDNFLDGLVDAKGRRGLDAHVGERGVKLSGGQRQRIAIARVILKNAPILVLDEATSALDSDVEAAIQDSLNTLMAGKTVIAIAHRLSTIAAMDRLIVMDQGQIVEQGCHHTLLAANGLYARLWNRQSGGFLNLDDAPQQHVI